MKCRYAWEKEKKKKKGGRLYDIVHCLHSPGLQHMASTRLQSMIQVVFYNSESQRKRTSEVSLQSPAWMVQTARVHARLHTYSHTKAYSRRCAHFAHVHTQGVYTHTHTSTPAWCFEGWDSVLKRQAARRSWPSSGTDEQLSQFLSECVFVCVCGGKRVCEHACMSKCACSGMHACVFFCVCAQRAGA